MFPDYVPEESNDLDSGEGPPLTCNTKKDKDSRFHRHMAEIFIVKGKITDIRKLKIIELIVKNVCFNKPSNLLFGKVWISLILLHQGAGRVGCVSYGMSCTAQKISGRSMGLSLTG